MDLHTALVVAHATAATGALLSGIPALWFPRRLLPAHLALLLVMTAALGPAVVIDLVAAAPGRWVFLGLFVLAVVMCRSSVRASRVFARDPVAGTHALGFSLISLLTGFVAVSVIGAGKPVVVVVIAIAAPILLGRVLVDRRVRTLPIARDTVRARTAA